MNPSPEALEKPVATKEEWAAMNSINRHFTFRERTAFLVGYRLAREQAIEEARAKYVGFNGLVRFNQERLDEFYPENIFDGSSGDSGPVFIVALRTAIRALGSVQQRGADPDHAGVAQKEKL